MGWSLGFCLQMLVGMLSSKSDAVNAEQALGEPPTVTVESAKPITKISMPLLFKSCAMSSTLS
jgi:hypothetical protein